MGVHPLAEGGDQLGDFLLELVGVVVGCLFDFVDPPPEPDHLAVGVAQGGLDGFGDLDGVGLGEGEQVGVVHDAGGDLVGEGVDLGDALEEGDVVLDGEGSVGDLLVVLLDLGQDLVGPLQDQLGDELVELAIQHFVPPLHLLLVGVAVQEHQSDFPFPLDFGHGLHLLLAVVEDFAEVVGVLLVVVVLLHLAQVLVEVEGPLQLLRELLHEVEGPLDFHFELGDALVELLVDANHALDFDVLVGPLGLDVAAPEVFELLDVQELVVLAAQL